MARQTWRAAPTRRRAAACRCGWPPRRWLRRHAAPMGRKSMPAGSTAGRAAGRPARSRAHSVNRLMSLKKLAVTSAGFSGEPNEGTILRRAASVCVGKGRQRHAAAHGRIGVDDAGAARDRQHADGVAFGQPPLREQLGDVHDRLDVIDLDQPRLAQSRAIKIVAAGHVGGMRSRGLDAGIGGGGFPDHHRLAGLQRLAADIEQAARIGRTFQIGEDQPKCRHRRGRPTATPACRCRSRCRRTRSSGSRDPAPPPG